MVLLLTPPGISLLTAAFANVKPPYGTGSGTVMSLFFSLIAIPVCAIFCGWFLASLGTRRPLLRVLITLGLAIPIAGLQLSLVWAGCALLAR